MDVSVRRAYLTVGLALAFAAVPLKALAGRQIPDQMPMPPALVSSRQIEVKALLAEAQPLLPKGAYLGPLLDDHYAVIDYHWLEKEFLPFYRRASQIVKDIASRTTEGADCDNYGMFMRQMVGLAGIIGRTDEPTAAQVVVFQAKSFGGVGRTLERHNVCLFLTDRGWFVLEPQNATRLTPLDRYSNRGQIQFITFH